MLLGMSLSLALGVDPTAMDRSRITEHLRRTEVALRAADVSGLGDAQQRARAENLDALHRYWVRGVYPRNTFAPGMRVPVFIDEEGRACAVGQLMIDSGAAALAEHVARDERLEYLATIETEGVETWIERSGLSAAELATIQPTYCNCANEPLEPVCGVDGNTYPNTCMAVDCAGVEVESDGPCEGNGESGNGVTDGATTGEGSSSGGGGSSSSTSGSSSGSGDGSSSGSGEAPSDDAAKGCRVGGVGGWWGLCLLLLARRRR